MWFGTLAGLNCYDGYTFKVFTRQEYNQNSLPDNFIESTLDLHPRITDKIERINL